MRSHKTLRLPKTLDLRSNSAEDIRKHLDRLYDELDRAWRLMWMDLNDIQVDKEGWIYFGNKDTDGTWRIGRSGNDWNAERRESGEWKTKSGAIP